ncbi:MAG: YihY/virulence factor BrkB family protein [Sphingobacteriales bacterium]
MAKTDRQGLLAWIALATAGLLLAGFRARQYSEPIRASRAGSMVGASAADPARPSSGGPVWKRTLFGVYEKIGKDRVVALAAGVTFYSILALFPAIAALVSLYGLFADPAAIAKHLDSMAAVLPSGAMQVIGDELNRLVAQGTGKLSVTFVFGLAVALWSANAGIKSLIDALNLVYEESERRGLIKLNVVSLAFTAGIIGFVLLALTGMLVLPIVLDYARMNADQLLKVARWPALLVVAAFGLAVLYRFGPCCRTPKWRWITWGSAFAAVAWLVVSLLFTWYAANFGSYNKTYGSLGAVIGFMVWIWISTIVVLLGAEIDAQLERHDPAAHPVTRRTRINSAPCRGV